MNESAVSAFNGYVPFIMLFLAWLFVILSSIFSDSKEVSKDDE